jgi:hypothetical protein
MPLDAFTFARSDAFLIPVEQLSPTGVAPTFAAQLTAQRGVSAAWLERFDAAWILSQQRLGALVGRAPRHWFPPRRTHVVVATDPLAAHPFHRPLFESASFLYLSDFDPGTSSLELSAFLLIQAERLHLAEQPVAALLASLSYFLTLDDAQAADFAAGAEACTRPDATAYRLLAAALPWVRQLHHAQLRPPTLSLPLGEIGQSGLLVASGQHPQVEALLSEFGAAAQAAVETHYTAHGQGPDAAHTQALLDWLAAEAPRVLIVGPDGEALWDPDAPAEHAALSARLGALPAPLAESMRLDLAAIDTVTRRFLDSVVEPEALPAPTEEIDQIEGTYLHQGRTLIAYALEQPVWRPLREPTPPYSRLSLAARAGHEWGHLADEAHLVGLPSDRETEHDQAKQAVAQAARDALAAAPPPIDQVVAQEMAQQGGADPGDYLVEFVLARIPDYVANLIAREVLDPEALETYVRVNVRGHLGERLPPVRLLAGLAIEYQYLALGQVEDPLEFFLGLCPSASIMLASGFLKREHLERLFNAVAWLCACYAIDEAAFRASR